MVSHHFHHQVKETMDYTEPPGSKYRDGIKVVLDDGLRQIYKAIDNAKPEQLLHQDPDV